MVPGQPGEALAGVEPGVVDVVGRVVDDIGAGRLPVAGRGSRLQERVVVLDVVVDAGRARVAAGHLGGHARIESDGTGVCAREYSAPRADRAASV